MTDSHLRQAVRLCREHPCINMPLHSIVRDGFEFSHGRFRVQRGDIELVSPSSLRDMFIPRISASAAKIVKEQPYFVAGQLQHYDVAYSPRELTGNGATLMKKLIQEGKVSITKN